MRLLLLRLLLLLLLLRLMLRRLVSGGGLRHGDARRVTRCFACAQVVSIVYPPFSATTALTPPLPPCAISLHALFSNESNHRAFYFSTKETHMIRSKFLAAAILAAAVMAAGGCESREDDTTTPTTPTTPTPSPTAGDTTAATRDAGAAASDAADSLRTGASNAGDALLPARPPPRNPPPAPPAQRPGPPRSNAGAGVRACEHAGRRVAGCTGAAHFFFDFRGGRPQRAAHAFSTWS